jgi:hypothetical protein
MHVHLHMRLGRGMLHHPHTRKRCRVLAGPGGAVRLSWPSAAGWTPSRPQHADVPPHAVAEGRRAASSEVKSRSWADVALVRYGCAASPGVDVLIDLVLSGSMRVGAAGIRVVATSQLGYPAKPGRLWNRPTGFPCFFTLACGM